MPDTLDAAELRRLAMQCGTDAESDGCSAEERSRLLKIREALLDLAQNADWLEGKVA